MRKTTKKKIIGYTAGAYDLFHIGHLNLLRNIKRQCDKLIVGVSTDELIQVHKNKKPVIPFEERIEIVKNIKFVDEVIPQQDTDKYKMWEKIKYDILFVGDDWKGNKRWVKYEKKLNKVNVKVVYLPYTKHTSSTKITALLEDLLKE